MYQLIAYLTVQAIAAIGWAFQLQGRVTTLEKVSEKNHDYLKELLDSRLDDIKERLERIERHVLNGKTNHD